MQLRQPKNVVEATQVFLQCMHNRFCFKSCFLKIDKHQTELATRCNKCLCLVALFTLTVLDTDIQYVICFLVESAWQYVSTVMYACISMTSVYASARKFDSGPGNILSEEVQTKLYHPQMFVIRSVSSWLGSVVCPFYGSLYILHSRQLRETTATKEVFLIKVNNLVLLSQHLLSHLHYYFCISAVLSFLVTDQ